MNAEGVTTLYREYMTEEYVLRVEPYYLPLGNEVEVFEAA